MPKFNNLQNWHWTVKNSQINNKMAAMIAISEDIAKPAPAVTVILQPSDGFSAPSAQLENKNMVNFTAKSKTWHQGSTHQSVRVGAPMKKRCMDPYLA